MNLSKTYNILYAVCLITLIMVFSYIERTNNISEHVLNIFNKENISIVAACIQAFSTFFVMLQIYVAKKQIEHDHERSRREKSVELLLEWSKFLTEEVTGTRKFLSKLNIEQCQSIKSQEIFCVSKKHKSLLVMIFKEKLEEKGEEIILDEYHAAKLRWLIIQYLNRLEAILVAWQYAAVDKEIIESQFKYLFSGENARDGILKNYRVASGLEDTSFPAIYLFEGAMKEKEMSNIKESKSIK